MKYGMERLINLGRFNIQFENIKLVVADCDTKEEAEGAIREWGKEIEAKFKKYADSQNVNNQ